MDLASIVLKESELERLFLSIFSLLVSAHFFGYYFSKFSLPRVVGEIFGGILLGPSFLGFFSQTYYDELFNYFPEQGKILAFLYWIGLVLLMLSAGFKIDRTSNAKDKKLILNLIISSTILPILGGILYCKFYDFTPYKGKYGTDFSISIIVCISIAITSIPIISKIFIDLNIIHSRFAKIILAAATLHDLILWTGLDAAIKSSNKGNANTILAAFTTILFLSFSLFLGPWLSKHIVNLNGNSLLKSSSIAHIIIVCFFMVIITNHFGINIVFGALMAGMIIGTLNNESFRLAKDSVSDFSLAFFIPIYFAIIGLKINLPLHFDFQLFLTFFLFSSFLEIGCVFMSLKLLKNNWLTSLNFGFAMNARGGPGIVMASIAYEFSIINEAFFIVLILVAIITSLISGAWFKFVLNHGWQLYEA